MCFSVLSGEAAAQSASKQGHVRAANHITMMLLPRHQHNHNINATVRFDFHLIYDVYSRDRCATIK